MITPPLYVGPGTAESCAAAHAAREAAKAAKEPLKTAAGRIGLARARMNRLANAHAQMSTWPVLLERDGSKTITVCTVVTPKGSLEAAKAAVRQYPGTLKGLELPGWQLRVGSMSYPLDQLLRDMKRAA
jgi:hypothetical protein